MRYEVISGQPWQAGKAGQPWRVSNSFSATVLYRNHKEIVDEKNARSKSLKEEDKGLVTRGVFGPILSTVVGDAARSGFTWSHWEQGAAGPEAVFRYVVPKTGSHYEVAPQNLTGKAEGESLQQFAGYHGEIAIDPATGTILRMTLVADLEPDQSILLGDIMVEYGPVEIGEKTYICPVRSVSVSEVKVIGFRAVQIFGATAAAPYKDRVERCCLQGLSPLSRGVPPGASFRFSAGEVIFRAWVSGPAQWLSCTSTGQP